MERLRIKIDVNELIIRLAKGNRGWGYGSMEGVWLHQGHDVSRSTIARVLVLPSSNVKSEPDSLKTHPTFQI